LKKLRLKKNEDRRLRAGHVWIFSNEIDTATSPLKQFSPGEEVLIEAADKSILGTAYINPNSLITARLYSRRSQEHLNEDFFAQRILSALQFRERLYAKPYYRLIFGESDGLPGLIVDRFNDVLSVQINTAGMEIKTADIITALRKTLPDIKSILLRNDSPMRLQEGLENQVVAAFGEPPEKVIVEENNALFHAPLWEGQKTGWFYDHRLNRTRLKEYVSQKRVLDIFSYLGAWGIQAANYGANEVTCIDASPLATASIKENAELNHVTDKVSIIQDDAFDALKRLITHKELFDVIILDPPAFVKKQKDRKEGLLAYQRINEMALKLLSPNGMLISCSCSMHVEYTDLVQVIRRANLKHHFNLQIIERGHQSPDHPIHLAIPETDYLKMIIVRKT
ncbi:MAG: class I SAM-dependent rRNA methyltransferase, partial [Gammaproteobacteria bacterium]|nr:class I SAM-dependent rRNA methyltransferase [Gammaproteobacteria bacterium]